VSRVKVGSPVPDFIVAASGDSTFSLQDARGSALVLYFYPRDSTPGCTLEGQQFQQLLPRFKRAGVRVVGVSRDSVASHDRFCSKMGFQFELLSDSDEKLCRLFDVIHEKNMYGRKVMGVVRSTFLIDAKGILRREWRKVTVDGHAAEVLEAAKSL
jgi:peroxiredoxin Q/BCP